MLNNNLSIWSFYCFVDISSPEMLIPKLLLIAKKKSIKGTIILSEEGFNGAISSSFENNKLLFDELIELTSAQDVNLKHQSLCLSAFNKFKIKIKKEIVTLGVGNLDVCNLKGKYIRPQNWDEFISQPDVVVIDTRNSYEFEKGSFLNALNPNTKNFRDLPSWVDDNFAKLKNKKVAMFCTGGIRCEKSTAYLKALGHEQVYHLEGGILQYFEDTKNSNGIWQGQCFVFDDRNMVAVDLLDPRIIL